MTSIMQLDIFFFITTIAVVIVTVLITVALIYIVLILKDIRNISEVVSKESRNFADDTEMVRTTIKAGLTKLFHVIVSFIKAREYAPRRRSHKSTKNEP